MAGSPSAERVGTNDNFFEIGGDSILSIQIISRARRIGLQLSPQSLFLNPTIAELATVTTGQDSMEIDRGPVDGIVPLTPIQHWFFSHDLSQIHHWNPSYPSHIINQDR